jgi:hypothetical protein
MEVPSMALAKRLLASNLRKLTDPHGRYDAVKVAHAFDWEQKEIARFLGKDPSSISKNPVSPSYQEALARLASLYQRVVELTGDDTAAAVAWLRTPIVALNNQSPKKLLLERRSDVVERLLREYESGLAL